MLSGAENKYLEGLAKLQSQIDNPKSRTKKAEDIQRRIGGLHKKHSRTAKHYEVVYDADTKKLSWSRRDEGYAAARELHGCCFLRSSIMTHLSNCSLNRVLHSQFQLSIIP